MADNSDCRGKPYQNRRPGHHEFAYLGLGISPGIDQRQPASLAEPDEIDQATKMID